MPKQKLSQVFQRYFRVSGPTHNTVPGMGLGLYISSEIIKRQKGKIWVESERAKGSIFYFSLPIAPNE
ncbi:MAG: ATP-binding protein [Candidatus Levyibacteriota bacterium]